MNLISSREFSKANQSGLILVGQVASALISMIAIALTARYVGPRIFSFCSLSLLLMTILMSFLDFGACSWAAREYAASRIKISEYRSIMRSKNLLMLLVFSLSPCFYIVLPDEFRNCAVFLIYPFFWNSYNFIQQFLITQKNLQKSIFLVVLDRVCWLLIIPLEFFQINSVVAFIMPILFGLSVHHFFGVMHLNTLCKMEIEGNKFRQIQIFRQSKYFGKISIASTAITLDSTLVTVLTDLVVSSNFILALRFRNPLTLVFNAIAIRIKPISACRNKELILKSIREDRKLLIFGVVSNLVMAIVLAILSDDIFGSKYLNLGTDIFVGTLTAIPGGGLLILASILTSTGDEKFVSSASTVYSCAYLLVVGFTAYYLNVTYSLIAILAISTSYFLIFLHRFLKFFQTNT